LEQALKRCKSCPVVKLETSDRSTVLDLPNRWRSVAMPKILVQNDRLLKGDVNLHFLQLPKLALVHVLFRICDVDGDMHLSSDELRPLGELTDFQGGAEEWRGVYDKLCASVSVNPSTGIDLPAFESLFTEPEPSACWGSFTPGRGSISCSENDLRQMLRKLAGGPGSICTTGPKIYKILADTLGTAATTRWSRNHCDSGHLLQWRSLKFHEGRVNHSICRLCECIIPRRDGRFSCKQCHYSVCQTCRASEPNL